MSFSKITLMTSHSKRKRKSMFNCILLTGFLFAMNFSFSSEKNTFEISNAKSSVKRSQSPEQTDCSDYSDVEFEDNQIIVTMNNELISDNGLHLYDNIDLSYFSEINIVGIKELTSETSNLIRNQVGENYQYIDTLYSPEFLNSHAINLKNYHQIFQLELSSHSKDNVLSSIQLLKNRGDVLEAEPNILMKEAAIKTTNGISYDTDQWAIPYVGIDQAWDNRMGSEIVSVGVIDSGIDGTHPDLVNNIDFDLSRNFSISTTGIHESTISTTINHGTHVAGIIGADGNNRYGISGVNPKAKLVSLRVTRYSKKEVYSSAGTLSSINYCAAHNIPIINCSFGETEISDNTKSQLGIAFSNYSGLVVAAAGNEGRDNDIYAHFPSGCNSLENVISVGNFGLDTFGEEYIDDTSNYGEKTVDLFAPGVDIYSTIFQGKYGKKSGTSMATPFVSGYASLLKSKYPDMPSSILKANILESVEKNAIYENKCVSGGRLSATNELKVLSVSLYSVNGDKFKVKITNPTDAEQEIIYNSKTCYEGDAKTWDHLTDICTRKISAGSSKIVAISRNGNADSIAVSYLRDQQRYITYSNIIANSALETHFTKKDAHYDDEVVLLGKNANQWKFRINNIYDEDITVQYNKKMCNADDAINWTEALADLETTRKIKPTHYKEITITENGWATHVAISIIKESEKIIVYADQLNVNGTLSLHKKSIDTNPSYLILTNKGYVDGKWKIQITNPNSFEITVDYNTLMCFNADARDWKNLNNTDSIDIPEEGCGEVYIFPNWFATSIAISYVQESRRYISYADGLSSDGSINVMYSQI